MDTFFVSHGSPTLAVDESIPARGFLRSWRSRVLEAAPRAILVVSAHWDTRDPAVNGAVDGAAPHDTIHDFYGFPTPMYQVIVLHESASLLSLRLLLNPSKLGVFGMSERDDVFKFVFWGKMCPRNT